MQIFMSKGLINPAVLIITSHLSEDVQSMLNEFTIRHPATKYALLNLEKNLAGACVSMADSIPSCEQCGEPTDGICQSCRIINEVTAHGT